MEYRFTDSMGYTTLMSGDEDHGFKILHRNRELHTKFIMQFNGTLIKEKGDGAQISFYLASEELRCYQNSDKTK